MSYLRVVVCVWLCAGAAAMAQANPANAAKAEKTAKLKAMLAETPVLALVGTDLPIMLPDGVELGMVSWMAYDAKTHVTWLLHRGDKIDPVLAVDASGTILHHFGKGMFTIPHAIRLDPAGNVWTVDAGSSKVMKFSPDGKLLMTIDVGGMPERKNGFAGTTDIGFGPKGHVFVTDGYGNARVLEYTADGAKVKEWGTAGVGPGEFHLPHSIAMGKDMMYVADRENGRIEKFDLDGKYLGKFKTDGRTYSIRLGKDGALWAGINPLDAPTSDPGWLVKMDAKTGKFLGYVAVNEKTCLHSVDVDEDGFPMTDVGSRVVRFRSR
jgi:sugar lactone lactonase YvrE